MKDKIKIGIIPIKRNFLSLENALREKKEVFERLRSIKGAQIELVDIDDIVESGIAWKTEDIQKVEVKFKQAAVDGIFLLQCDFGTEEIAGRLGKAMEVPVLLWGPRDEIPNTAKARGRDTQCGTFATSKVLQRYKVPFSYIVNSRTNTEKFTSGFDTFQRTVSVVKSIRKLRIAQIGSRPRQFMSVIYNEGELLNKFGIEVVPLNVLQLTKRVNEMAEADASEVIQAYDDICSRMDTQSMDQKAVKKIAALKVVLKAVLVEEGCDAAALECWSYLHRALGIAVCLAVAELSDLGIPVACETDIHGAVTSAMLQAAALGEPVFFADLTIRHPQNDNAELLWHCGPFPYSLKADDSQARLDNGRAEWRLKKGEITIARFDGIGGEYFLFGGEGKAVDGPETTGTYVWLEVDNWEKWEEKFIFGPYIHHVSGAYGKYSRALMEACKYIPGLKADPVTPFTLSL